MPNAYVEKLSDETRERNIKLLNARLADAIDLANMVKQAHWNLKGRGFIGVHELLDEVNMHVREAVDLIAERSVILGGYARGTSQEVIEKTSLQPYPVEMSALEDHAATLRDRLMAFGGLVREAIDEADDDEDTADLFTEISRRVDKDAWFIGAHVEK